MTNDFEKCVSRSRVNFTVFASLPETLPVATRFNLELWIFLLKETFGNGPRFRLRCRQILKFRIFRHLCCQIRGTLTHFLSQTAF